MIFEKMKDEEVLKILSGINTIENNLSCEQKIKIYIQNCHKEIYRLQDLLFNSISIEDMQIIKSAIEAVDFENEIARQAGHSLLTTETKTKIDNAFCLISKKI